jgi:ABC-2 type transport system permease protein
LIVLKILTRVLAVVGKEIVEVLRRPSALATLVVGPVIILAAFGLGYRGQPPLRAVLVIPAGSGLPTDSSAYLAGSTPGVTIVATTSDAAGARQELDAGKVDLVVIAPSDARERLNAGKQATIQVEYRTADPYADYIAKNASAQLAAQVNQRLIEQLARESEAQAGPNAPGVSFPPPEVIAAPTKAEARDVAPTKPDLVAFYGVAILALILQHLAVTLGALSMARDRRRGIIAMFRVAPVAALELLAGKYVAFVALTALVGLVLGVLLVLGMGVPMLGATGLIVAALGLLIVASVGLGLLLSLVTDSETQVVQLALLLLIASVFFGGLAIDLTQFAQPVQVAAEFLPVTQGIHLAQDLFLLGSTDAAWRFGVLAAMAVILFFGAWWFFRRTLRPAR